MNLKEYISCLDARIKKRFGADAAHDLYHLYRVYNMALKIQSREGGDKLVIGVAAFLHDIHRVMQAEAGRFCYPKESLPIVKKLLIEVGFPKDKMDSVLHVVEHHEEYSFSYEGRKAHDIETLIVQDADNLDAMGALGIARTFTFNALLKLPMWNPGAEKNTKHYDEHKTDTTVIDHFNNKLLRLKDSMSTKTARKIANERHKYMKAYVERFKKEWYGKI